MLVLLVLLMRFMPRLPGAFVVVTISIILVKMPGLDQLGVVILGEVPAGLPELALPSFDPRNSAICSEPPQAWFWSASPAAFSPQ
jgi:MFS superfamily sulfate permease-like transporter